MLNRFPQRPSWKAKSISKWWSSYIIEIRSLIHWDLFDVYFPCPSFRFEIFKDITSSVLLGSRIVREAYAFG